MGADFLHTPDHKRRTRLVTSSPESMLRPPTSNQRQRRGDPMASCLTWSRSSSVRAAEVKSGFTLQVCQSTLGTPRSKKTPTLAEALTELRCRWVRYPASAGAVAVVAVLLNTALARSLISAPQAA